jgi:hypothetical protein
MLLCMFCAAVSARTINVSGIYTANSTNATLNQFAITSGGNMCGSGYLANCDKQIYQIHELNNSGPNITFATPRTITDTGIPDQDWLYFKANQSKHVVTLTDDNNNIFDVTVEVTHLGAYFDDGDKIGSEYSTAGCAAASGALPTGRGGRLIHLLPASKTCVTKYMNSGSSMDSLKYTSLYVGFTVMPNAKPFDLKAGRYTGNLMLTLGNTGSEDIYTGNNDLLDINNKNLNVNFNFVVTHMLKVRTLGDTRVPLQPELGWPSWQANNRAAASLKADSTFYLSTSAAFTMRLECQYPGPNDNCALQSSLDSHLVKVKTSASLPAGITVNNQPVLIYPLSTEKSQRFQPDNYIDGGIGTLHFKISKGGMAEMLKSNSNAASSYRGRITVIWDANI